MSKPIHIAVGVLFDAAGQALLAKRSAEAHQGGLWEFPGGKCESGEDVVEALIRELNEELAIEISHHRPLIRVTHHYDDRSVLLDVHRINSWSGDVQGREGQVIKWVNLDELGDYPMPAANKPIVQALQLPDTYLITKPQIEDAEMFLQSLDDALGRGVRLLQFRVFDMPEAERNSLLLDAKARCELAGADLLLNADAILAHNLGIAGLHLSSRQLYEYSERPKGVRLLAASCHNIADLQQAERIGADFAMLSPVMPTRSHPDVEPLGWKNFAEMIDEVNMPVYALGGMKLELLGDAWSAGAQGIAGIRGLW